MLVSYFIYEIKILILCLTSWEIEKIYHAIAQEKKFFCKENNSKMA